MRLEDIFKTVQWETALQADHFRVHHLTNYFLSNKIVEWGESCLSFTARPRSPLAVQTQNSYEQMGLLELAEHHLRKDHGLVFFEPDSYDQNSFTIVGLGMQPSYKEIRFSDSAMYLHDTRGAETYLFPIKNYAMEVMPYRSPPVPVFCKVLPFARPAAKKAQAG